MSHLFYSLQQNFCCWWTPNWNLVLARNEWQTYCEIRMPKVTHWAIQRTRVVLLCVFFRIPFFLFIYSQYNTIYGQGDGNTKRHNPSHQWGKIQDAWGILLWVWWNKKGPMLNYLNSLLLIITMTIANVSLELPYGNANNTR